MSDKKDHYIKDYTKVLNKSRKRRKRIPDRRHILVAVGAVVVFTSAVLAGRAVVARRQPKSSSVSRFSKKSRRW